ncbi:MAG: 3'-5' exoribonuclease YhaM family protein [Candidatus Hydrogenedentota bacterium]
MKSQYVNTLQEGDAVNDYFVVARKDLRPTQRGSTFLGMVFKDRTGDIGGVLWKNADSVARLFELGDVVNVRGKVQTYQGNLQVQVQEVCTLKTGEYDRTDLVFTPESAKQDIAKLRTVLDGAENTWLKQLNTAFLDDPVFLAEFENAAAAKRWHHAYSGGLVRHCVEMMRIAETVAELFPELDRDLLMTAIFLHDVGKLTEMTQSLFIDYTTPGKLIGHIQIGVDMVHERIRQIPGFPEPLRLQLIHCILSHHGEYANGAPVLPKTIEAIMLHHIDNLDAQASAFNRIIAEARERGQTWSDYMPLIQRVVYTKDDL